MGRSNKRPAWFKMFYNQKGLIDSMPDEVVGKAMKAVYEYFDTGFTTGEAPDGMDPQTFAVFLCIKVNIEESFDEYRQAVENGKLAQIRPHEAP